MCLFHPKKCVRIWVRTHGQHICAETNESERVHFQAFPSVDRVSVPLGVVKGADGSACFRHKPGCRFMSKRPVLCDKSQGAASGNLRALCHPVVLGRSSFTVS